MRQTLAERF